MFPSLLTYRAKQPGHNAISRPSSVIHRFNIEHRAISLQRRSTSLTVLTTVGNIGAILGNIIFSALLELHRVGPFIGMGCLLLGKPSSIPEANHAKHLSHATLVSL